MARIGLGLLIPLAIFLPCALAFLAVRAKRAARGDWVSLMILGFIITPTVIAIFHRNGRPVAENTLAGSTVRQIVSDETGEVSSSSSSELQIIRLGPVPVAFGMFSESSTPTPPAACEDDGISVSSGPHAGRVVMAGVLLASFLFLLQSLLNGAVRGWSACPRLILAGMAFAAICALFSSLV